MKKITLWYIADSEYKNGEITFNHIEDGWLDNDRPQPIKPEFTNQLAWQNYKWIRTFKYLVDGKIYLAFDYSTGKPII